MENKQDTISIQEDFNFTTGGESELIEELILELHRISKQNNGVIPQTLQTKLSAVQKSLQLKNSKVSASLQNKASTCSAYQAANSTMTSSMHGGFESSIAFG